MVNNSFTLDSQNVNVVIPNKRIKVSNRKGSKELTNAGKRFAKTKIKGSRPTNLKVRNSNLSSVRFSPDVIEMGSKMFTKGKRG